MTTAIRKGRRASRPIQIILRPLSGIMRVPSRKHELYLDITDRMTDKHGKDVPKSCQKKFFRITTSDTERFIADVVFNVTEDQHGV